MANAIVITVLVGVGYMVLKSLVRRLARIELKEQTKQRVYGNFCIDKNFSFHLYHTAKEEPRRFLFYFVCL